MSRRRHLIFVSWLVALVSLAGLWAGCTVSDEVPPGDYQCETEADCIEGFECNDGWCEEVILDRESPCVDEDDDGYGTNDDRRNCDYPQRDCNDDDPDINPGQSELCDGIDNDCDGGGEDGAHRVDDFECTVESISADCGSPPSELSFLRYECRQNTCTLVPPVQKQDLQCHQMHLTCDSDEQAFTYELDGQTYTADTVPQECRS